MRFPALTAAVVAALLGVGLLVLLFRGPHFTTEAAFDEATATVRCASVVAVGWPTDGAVLQHEDSFSHYSDHVVNDVALTQTQRLGIALECADRRTTYLGFVVVLAVGTSLLGSLALSRRRSV